MRLRIGSVLLLMALLLLQGCIITYRDFPEAKISTPAKGKEFPRTYFSLDTPDTHFDQLFESLIRDRSYFSGVERILDPSKSPTPEKAIPEKGHYLRVQFVTTPVGPARKVWVIASSLTLGIVPYWSSDAGWGSQLGEPTRNPTAPNKIRFSLFADGKLVKSFEYGYREVVVNFILLAPFAWINFFTYYGDDVLTAMFNQFLDDARPVIAQMDSGPH